MPTLISSILLGWYQFLYQQQLSRDIGYKLFEASNPWFSPTHVILCFSPIFVAVFCFSFYDTSPIDIHWFFRISCFFQMRKEELKIKIIRWYIELLQVSSNRRKSTYFHLLLMSYLQPIMAKLSYGYCTIALTKILKLFIKMIRERKKLMLRTQNNRDV